MMPMRIHENNARRVQGFSLIELMVGMVAGMLVVGSVLAFTVSSLRSNTELVQSIRLTQELRNTLDQATRELRRAGFDQAFMEQIALPAGSTFVSPFSPILISGEGTVTSCIVFAYDRDPTTAGSGTVGAVDLAAGEIRALRRVTATINGATVGIVELATSSAGATPACDDATANYTTYPASCNGVWCPLSDPRVVSITSFRIDSTETDVSSSGLSALSVRIRDLQLTVQGEIVGDSAITRSIQSRVRVRSDCLRTNLAACNAAPIGA